MRVEVTPGVSLAGEVRGSQGPWVVFIHGWMMGSAVFDPLWERIDLPLRLARIDLRGAGSSDRPTEGHDLARYGADVLAWMDAAGIDRATLVGHSMGGQIAQWIAAHAQARVAKLVLLNPVPAGGLPLPADVFDFFSTSGGNREAQGGILDQACLQLPNGAREALLDIAGTVDGDAIRASLHAWTAGGFAEDLPGIRAETHVIGTSDPFLPPDFLQAALVDRIPNATLHVLEGPGHYPMWEAADRTAELVTSLL